MTRFAKNRRGAKRKPGARYANGRLKPEPVKNKIVAARRSAICKDITKATCPLDAALANDWLSEADHRAAATYASLYHAARINGPGFRVATDLSTPSSALDVRGVEFKDMDRSDVAKAFDNAMSSSWLANDDDGSSGALTLWRSINAKLPREAAAELFAVSITESWPQWINQRKLVEGIQARAKKAKRELSDDETKMVEKAKRWEAKRDLLIEACDMVRTAMREDRKPKIAAIAQPKIMSMPGPKVSETTVFVDPMGNHIRTVVVLRRKGAK